MNTPSHCILNLALLSKTIAPHDKVAVVFGAILPDLPIFIFYFVAKYIQKLPEREIWSSAYYQPFWQNLVALTHSIPLATVVGSLCYYWGQNSGVIVAASMIAHSLLDLPVHHDDAHRHFYPLNNYRFVSPISYWDRNHYGTYVALVELLFVLAVTPIVFTLLTSGLSKVLILGIDLLYVVCYIRFYVLKPTPTESNLKT